MSNDIRNQILGYMKPMQMVMLATSRDGHPYVRPVTLLYHNCEFYVATGTSDAKTGQLRSNPNVEVCLMLSADEYSGYIRARGKMIEESSPLIREEIYQDAPYIKHYWQESSNPGFALFRMTWQEADLLKPGEDLATTISW